MIVVQRPAYGISLNAGFPEVLLNEDGTTMKFSTVQKAREFMVSVGYDEDSLNGIEFKEEMIDG